MKSLLHKTSFDAVYLFSFLRTSHIKFRPKTGEVGRRFSPQINRVEDNEHR